MGLFNRKGRDSYRGADSADENREQDAQAPRSPEPPAAPSADGPEDAPEAAQPKPSANGASGSWPGEGETGDQPDKPDESDESDEFEWVDGAQREDSTPAPEASSPEPQVSASEPIKPPEVAPQPRRVDDDDDDDEPGEVRLRAEDIIAPTPQRPHPFAPGPDGTSDPSMRARVIAFANQKGGVAKTTTTLNLAVAFKELGNDVLIIDLDPQGNLTMSQGIDPDSLDKSMYNVLVEHIPISEVIHQREVDVAVASIDLAGAEIAMSTQIGRERSLQKALAEVGDNYDFVCIDTPPSLGLLTVNALTAAHRVVVPVQCEYLSMRGLVQLQNTLSMIRDNLNPEVQIEGILPTMMDTRTVHAKEAVEILEENFGDLVFKTRIRKAVKFAEAPVRGSSVLKYDPEGRAATYYRELAEEVLANVEA